MTQKRKQGMMDQISEETVSIKRNLYRWLNLTDEEISQIRREFQVLSPKAKRYFKFTPFLSVVLTQNCNLRCPYCGKGGEGTFSTTLSHDLDKLIGRIKEALEVGVKKIRLTGGETFLYKDLPQLLTRMTGFKKDYDFFLLINTNGTISTIKELIPLLKKVNAKVVVHLDTIDRKKHFRINGSNETMFNNLIENIKLLRDHGLLHRFNTVLTKHNIKDFDRLIDFAIKMKTNIKCFDVTEVPKQYVKKQKIYVALDGFIRNLEKRAKSVFFHPYAIAFGTPVKIYDLGQTLITVKYTKHGSRYSARYCQNCQFFPCDEGLYDVLYYPDDTLWACRWNRPSRLLKGNFKKDLRTLFEVYQNTVWFVGNKFLK